MKRLLGLLFGVMVATMAVAAQDNPLSDPTRPQAYAPAGSIGTGVSVRGVIIGKGRKVVNIGNQYFQVGDVVSGYRVVSISRDSVKLEKQGKIRALPVGDAVAVRSIRQLREGSQ